MKASLLVVVLSFFHGLLHAKIINQGLDPTFAAIEAALGQSDKSTQVRLCFNTDSEELSSIDKTTRYFLYRRFAGLVYQEPAHIQHEIENKFALMSYLACRESGGRVVAQVAHGIGDKKKAAKGTNFYGRNYASLKNALMELVRQRLSGKGKAYFDETTNGGPFQVSADQVDNVPHKRDRNLEVMKFFYARVKELGKLSQSSLLKSCGTHEYFDVDTETDIPQALEDSVDWIESYLTKDAPLQKTWFRRVDELVWFHQLQTLCPDLNLELAKKIHHFHKGGYFGPLNNTYNAKTCGTLFSLCLPVFENITQTLNQI